MKKIQSMILASAAVVSMLAACSKENSSEGEKTDVNDPSTVRTENLIVYLPLESAENAVALGEGVSYAKKGGSATFAKGVRGNAYQNSSADCNTFSFLDFKLASSNKIKDMSSFTISAWVKSPVPNEGSPAMFSIDGGDPGMGSLLIMNEGWGCNADSLYMKNYLYNTSTEWKGQDLGKSHPAFTTDKWFHYVYSYNEETSAISMYSNGQFIASSERWAGPKDENENQEKLGKLTLDPNMAHLYIGAWFNNTDGSHSDTWRTSYPGMVDEIRIWNTALTDEEILDLYKKEVAKSDNL